MSKFRRLATSVLFFTLFLLLAYAVAIYKTYYFLNNHASLLVDIYSLVTGVFLLSRFIIAVFYDDEHTQKFPKSAYPSVTFIIACKNEEDSIAKTIETTLNSEYPGKMDCIAVDDGSTDKTLSEMKRLKKKYGRTLQVIEFPENRGKREAMAEGALVAKGEILIFVDSDSFLKPDAAKHIVEHFLIDPKAGAVAGNSLVENVDVNALTKMQSARYGVSFDIFKACESVFGTVTCCPGCFSAYRKEAVLSVLDRWRNQTFLGSRSTFGDDRSLTNYVLRTWKVLYCRTAQATTIVPDKYKKFFKQQFRWKKSWIREGANAGSFIWKKNIIASLSFYINLLIPVFGPIIVFKVLFIDTITTNQFPTYFLSGVLVMSILFGIYYYLIHPNKYWIYAPLFTIIYTFILIWQMPYALLRLKDTSWGTR